MKLEQQVVSLELAKKLKELGVKQESLFWWRNAGQLGWQVENDWYIRTRSALIKRQPISAYTVAEIVELLPKHSEHLKLFKSVDKRGQFCCYFKGHTTYGKTMANSAAKMLIYLLENKLI